MFFFNPIFQLIGLLFQLLFWGLIIAAIVIVVRALARSGAVPEEEIMERWTAFLPNQAGADEEFLALIESELDARNCPYEVARRTFTQGFGSSNPFVRVKMNFAYSCYMGFEKIGKDIQFNWAVREKMSPLYRIPVLGPILYRIFTIATFIDRNKLLAFASFTKNCTENVVDAMMDKYELDKNKVVRASSGKLGPL